MFLLGQVTGNSVQNDEYLEVERMMHRDLIRGAQREHYYNLTLKTQMGLEWASKYCDFQYLLKAADDVFVNPYLLTDLIYKSLSHLKQNFTRESVSMTGFLVAKGSMKYPKQVIQITVSEHICYHQT